MATININNTSYNVEDDWLKVAIQYFNINPKSENAVNMLKAGLFGYNNEIQSNEIKNNVYHRNILKDEHFLNTASFPESIAGFAKLHGVPVDLANPSHMRATLALRRMDLIENPFKKQVIESDLTPTGVRRKVFELTLSNEYTFTIERIPFRLPYPIQFIMKQNENSSEYSITARYKVEDGVDFPFLETLSNPYLKVWNENVTGTDYIFIGIDLFQLFKQTSTFNISNNDIKDNIYLYNDFDDQLAYINVFYNYDGVKEKIKVYQNNHYIPDSKDQKYCYFTVVDSNTVQLSFSSDPNAFRPRMNSEIILEMFSTKGAIGNFTYNGEIRVNFNNGSQFDKIPVKITPITDAKGGYDKLTNTEIKRKVIESLLGRKNIITDTDLEFYFNNFNTDNAINNSRVSFYKKRNDVLRRLLSGYLLLRDRENKVVPTNTAPHLYISEDYFENPFGADLPEDSEGMILENTKVLYDRLNDKFFLYMNNVISLTDDDRFLIDNCKNTDYPFYVEPHNLIVGYYVPESDSSKKLLEFRVDERNNLTKRESTWSLDDKLISSYSEWNPVSKGYEEVAGEYREYKITTKENKLVVTTKGKDDEDVNVVYNIHHYSFCLDNKNLKDSRFILYAIPYVIKMLEKPIYKSKYYKTAIYHGYTTKVKNINSLVDKNFIINSLEVKKHPNVSSEGSSLYNFFVELNTNITNDDMKENLKIRMIFYDKDDVNRGFVEFLNNEGTTTFEAAIATDDDIISTDEKIKIINSLYNTNGSMEKEDVNDVVFLSDIVRVELAVLYRDGHNEFRYGAFQGMKDLNQTTKPNGEVLNGFTTAVVYSTDRDVVLFKKLDKYIESDLVPKWKEVTIGENKDNAPKIRYFDLRQVPLVEYEYYQLRYEDLLDTLDIYDDMILNIVDRLENNNSLDMKFYNTHGTSYYWVTDTNGKEFKEENFDYVDVTAIPLEFTIYTSKVISNNDDNDIKEFISKFVEECNESGLFAISNLLRVLEETFEYIRYVEFGRVAGEETQKIFNNFTDFVNMTSQEINDFVPEFLNIKKKIIDYSKNDEQNESKAYYGSRFVFDISIKYK